MSARVIRHEARPEVVQLAVELQALASLTLGALLAGAAVQAFRGQFLPASVTLLAYAMRLVPTAGRR